MKRISKIIIILCLISFFSAKSFAQSNVGQVYFIRSLNYVGSIVHFKVFIDDTLVCKLNNNRFSQHEISAGKHTVAIQNTGLSIHKKSTPLTITVEAGKSVYLTVVNGRDLYLQEVTLASAAMLFKKTAPEIKCL